MGALSSFALLFQALSEHSNFQSGVTKRDSKQLKKCWENVKARCRKKMAREKREAKVTDGVSSSSIKYDEAGSVASIILSQMES